MGKHEPDNYNQKEPTLNELTNKTESRPTDTKCKTLADYYDEMLNVLEGKE